MTTVRTLRDDVQNTLDYLLQAELAIYTNPVSYSPNRVAWHASSARGFLASRQHPDVGQYLAWVAAGAYSAALFDGSLLQIAYDIEGDEVTKHRLAYIPCPYEIDHSLLAEGYPIADVVDLYRDLEPILRSPLRFDFDAAAASDAHPAVHLTFNSVDCRIECVAPMHVLRFVDFVFRQFYGRLWAAHRQFFAEAAWRHLNDVSDPRDRRAVHVMWDVHATASSAGLY
jgi:hypothetical protein